MKRNTVPENTPFREHRNNSIPGTDFSFARYWQQLERAQDIRVIEQAADETEHLLATATNRERLNAALDQTRPAHTSHWYH